MAKPQKKPPKFSPVSSIFSSKFFSSTEQRLNPLGRLVYVTGFFDDGRKALPASWNDASWYVLTVCGRGETPWVASFRQRKPIEVALVTVLWPTFDAQGAPSLCMLSVREGDAANILKFLQENGQDKTVLMWDAPLTLSWLHPWAPEKMADMQIACRLMRPDVSTMLRQRAALDFTETGNLTETDATSWSKRCQMRLKRSSRTAKRTRESREEYGKLGFVPADFLLAYPSPSLPETKKKEGPLSEWCRPLPTVGDDVLSMNEFKRAQYATMAIWLAWEAASGEKLSDWRPAPKMMALHDQWYRPLFGALSRLSERGFVVDQERISSYLLDRFEFLQEQAVLALQRFKKTGILFSVQQASLKTTLENPSAGENEEILLCWRRAFNAEAAANKVSAFPSGERVSGRSLRVHRFDRTCPETFALYKNITETKKLISEIQRIAKFSARDGNIHSLFKIATITDRLVSLDPNSQNFTKEEQLRRCLLASTSEKDHVYVSVDLAQIELRNACALGLRAQQEVFSKIAEGGDQTSIAATQKEKWEQFCCRTFQRTDWDVLSAELTEIKISLRAMEYGRLNTSGLRIRKVGAGKDARYCPDDPLWQLRGKAAAIAVRLAQYEENGGIAPASPMRTIFKENGDPHWITGLSLKYEENSTQARVRFSQMNDAEKEALAYVRNAAKPSNFGLMYGMETSTFHTNGIVQYHMDWTLEQAFDARFPWFFLYPEVFFWQCWTLLRPIKDNINLFFESGDFKPNRVVSGQSYKVSSLTGRPYNTTSPRVALNEQSQGTVAHIMAKAMGEISKNETYDIAYSMIDQVHDELVCGVPRRDAETLAPIIAKALYDASASVLGEYDVPVAVSVDIQDVWL